MIQLGIGLGITRVLPIIYGGSPPPVTYHLLTEGGDFLFTEGGDFLDWGP